MPQMAPYNWFILFMLFNFINFIIISMNYYLYTPNYKITLKMNLKNEFFKLKW